jgi:hypothetical protein
MPLARETSVALLVLASVGASAARAAEPAPEIRASSVTDTRGSPAPCARGQGSLSTIACSLAAGLLPAASGAEVTVVELKSDRELPAAEALKQRLQSSVRAALAAVSPGPTKPAKLRLELRLEKSGSSLRVTADLTRAVGLWQRLRKTKPRPLLHAFVEVPIDAELRTLIPPPPLVVSEVLKLKAPERGIVALACGGFGPEGAQELALVSRSHVRVGGIAGRAFVERARVAWPTLSPIAPAPLREPIATADVTPGGRLRVGISDRRDSVELDGGLGVAGRFEGLLPAPGGGCVARSGVGLSGKIISCSAPESLPPLELNALLDSIAGSGAWRAGRELGTGKLRQPGGELGGLGRVGAQLALGDADGDGTPELAYSADVLEPARDRLVVVSVNGNRVQRRFELAAPAGISAITVCRAQEGPGMAPFALVSGDELWLIR